MPAIQTGCLSDGDAVQAPGLLNLYKAFAPVNGNVGACARIKNTAGQREESHIFISLKLHFTETVEKQKSMYHHHFPFNVLLYVKVVLLFYTTFTKFNCG